MTNVAIEAYRRDQRALIHMAVARHIDEVDTLFHDIDGNLLQCILGRSGLKPAYAIVHFPSRLRIFGRFLICIFL